MISLQLLNMLSTYLIIRKNSSLGNWRLFLGTFYILKLPTSQDHFLLFFLFILFVSLLPIIYFISLYGWLLINQSHQINRFKTRFIFLYKTALQMVCSVLTGVVGGGDGCGGCCGCGVCLVSDLQFVVREVR